MQTELLEKIERITKLANLIRAEMDNHFIDVIIDRNEPRIFLTRNLDRITSKFDCDYFKEAFPDYEVTDNGKMFNKLSVHRGGIEIMVLADKEEVNDEL